MAVIGKAKAVAQIGTLRVRRLLRLVALGRRSTSAFSIGFRNRLQVLLSWFWNWLLNARDARLITGDASLNIRVPRSSAFVPDPPSAPDVSGRKSD